LKQCLDENPGIRGIMLGSHGLFTWGDTAYESYINTLEVIERCAQYLEDNYGKKDPYSAAKNYSRYPGKKGWTRQQPWRRYFVAFVLHKQR
jgi:rhamnose utilization protein RhaD (predicted bifunctional aldolase and dehydrogenase)